MDTIREIFAYGLGGRRVSRAIIRMLATWIFSERHESMGRTTRNRRMDYDCALFFSFGFLMAMEWNIYAHGHVRIQNMIPEDTKHDTKGTSSINALIRRSRFFEN